MNQAPTHHSLKIIRVKDVAQKVGIARSTLYDWLNSDSPRFDCSFPKPIYLNKRSIGWIELEIDNWIESKMTARH